MARDTGTTGDSAEFHGPHVKSALRVSVQSIVWTVVASTASVALGIRTGTAVLIAFGAIGIVDGSVRGGVRLGSRWRRSVDRRSGRWRI